MRKLSKRDISTLVNYVYEYECSLSRIVDALYLAVQAKSTARVNKIISRIRTTILDNENYRLYYFYNNEFINILSRHIAYEIYMLYLHKHSIPIRADDIYLIAVLAFKPSREELALILEGKEMNIEVCIKFDGMDLSYARKDELRSIIERSTKELEHVNSEIVRFDSNVSNITKELDLLRKEVKSLENKVVTAKDSRKHYSEYRSKLELLKSECEKKLKL